MKKIWLIAVVVAVFVFANFSANATPSKVDQLLSESISEGKELNYYEIVNAYDEYFKNIPEEQRAGWKQYQRWKYFTERRINPDGTFPEWNYIGQQAQSVEKFLAKEMLQNLDWELIGPTDEPNAKYTSTGVGRINCVRFHPDNPAEIWVGAAAGGVWKTTNGGDKWNVVSPARQFWGMGVTDIAIAPSSPNVIYVATGDAHGARSTGYNTYSVGIIKSTDAGNTWFRTKLSYELNKQALIGRVLVHPENENIVFAATDEGILKSTDGGETWVNKVGPLYFIDMEFKADDPIVMIASTFSFGSGGAYIYKSEDLGETWTRVYTVTGAKRITIDVTEADPNYMYALSGYWQDDNFNSFDLSTDAGTTWFNVSKRAAGFPNILGREGGSYDDPGQAWYDLALGVSPISISDLFTGGIDIWRSNSSGANFSQATHNRAQSGLPFVHADIHDLQYTPDGSKIYAGTDGGVAVSTDMGLTWIAKNNGLAITQYYKFGITESDPDYIVGGTQDNGSSRLRNGEWDIIMEGDGMDCYINPKSDNIILASLYYGDFRRSTNYGNSFEHAITASQKGEPADWVAPLAFSEKSPNVVFVGFTNVYRSTNSGGSPWTKISNFGTTSTLIALAVAPNDVNHVYAATRNSLFATYDGGDNWTNLGASTSGLITGIAVDPNNPKRLWISVGQFAEHSKVWEYDGEEWINRTGNLPNVPVNCITYQNDSPDRLYIGTDIGVWYSDYNSGFWEPYGNNIPYAIVSDIEINYTAKKIYASTHGRGLWKTDLIECNLPQPQIEADGPTEFCAGETVILRLVGDYDNFKWSNGASSKEISVGKSGTYNAIIQDKNGCSAASQPIVVKVNDFPEMEITPGKYAAFCEGQNEEVTLTATLGFEEYEWNTGETTGAITVTEEGEYYVIGTTAEGCKSTSEIYTVLSASPPEAPEIKQRGRDIFVDDIYTSYVWFRNGKLEFQYKEHDIKQFDPEWVGDTITVVVTDVNGCSATSTAYPILTGVGDNNSRDLITVTPNPGNGIYTLKASLIDNKNIDIIITNMLGQEVFAKRNVLHYGSVSYDIDISSQPAGVYILNISGQEFSWNTKLIKE